MSTAEIEAPAVEDETPRAWRIPLAAYEATIAKIAKINERADRKGFTGRFDVTGAEVRHWEYSPFDEGVTNTGWLDATAPDGSAGRVPTHYGKVMPGLWVEVIEYDVTLTGEAPCYGGWTFAATLDWDDAAGLIVRSAPGADPVDREGLTEGHCDHCRTTRRRTATYLVVNKETGEQRQVGTSCIKDFLGWSGSIVWYDAATIAKEIDDEIDSWGSGGRYRETHFSTRTALAVAWAAIKTFGYIRASAYEGVPTKTAVLTVLDPFNRKDREFAAQLSGVIDESYERADEIRAFILSNEFTGDSDYVVNLKAIAAADLVSRRNMGFLVSAPQAHARHLEQTLIRERAADMGAGSEWIGEVVTGKGKKRDRRVFTGTVVSIKYIGTSYYGYSEQTRTLYTVLTDDGNLVKLWNSHPTYSDGVFGAKEGVRITFKATITEHGEYQGKKETTVQRPADVEITDDEAAAEGETEGAAA